MRYYDDNRTTLLAWVQFYTWLVALELAVLTAVVLS